MRDDLIKHFAAEILAATNYDFFDNATMPYGYRGTQPMISPDMAERLAKVIAAMIDAAREPSSD